jgi:Uma2 family endonuclease
MTTILQEAAAGRAIVQTWTVDLYHRAVAEGLIEESPAFELLDGFIVRKDRAAAGEDPVTIGDRHRLVVQRLVKLAAEFDPLGCTLQIQQPIQLPPENEPEPDASVVRGTDDDYREGPPRAGDVLCVIEVADSSLSRDVGIKLRAYARAGIPQYVVVDLVNNTILDHHAPGADRYAEVRSLGSEEILELRAAAGRTVPIPVARLLP